MGDDGSTFFWSCLVSPWYCLLTWNFKSTGWVGFIESYFDTHTHTKIPSPNLKIQNCDASCVDRSGAQPQPIASNLQASFRRKMMENGYVLLITKHQLNRHTPYFTTFINRFLGRLFTQCFWTFSSKSSFRWWIFTGGKTGKPYGFLGNIRGITTSPLRILWQLHLSILSNGMVYPLSGSYIDQILGDGDYLDLFVWWLGKKSPNGAETWWFTMVESAKNHQLNKQKTIVALSQKTIKHIVFKGNHMRDHFTTLLCPGFLDIFKIAVLQSIDLKITWPYPPWNYCWTRSSQGPALLLEQCPASGLSRPRAAEVEDWHWHLQA